MRLTFTMPASICIGSEDEYHARVTGTYTPGRPAYTPRGEYAPIDPPEDPEFEIDTIELSHMDAKAWHPFPLALLTDEQVEAINDAAYGGAELHSGPDPDDVRDRRRDDAAMEWEAAE